MDLSNFMEAIKNMEEALKCKICCKLFHEPLLNVKCGHTTCKSCFIEHTNVNMTCPVCDVPINTKDFLEDKQLKELNVQLEQLKVLLQSVEGTGASNLNKNHIEKIRHSDSCTPKVKISTQKTHNSENTPMRVSEPKTRGRNKKVQVPKASPAGSINKKNHKGETVLQCAVIKGDVSKVKELLKEGALVNTQDHNGWTPLHEASNRGFVELAAVLLDNGALVNVPSLKENITPLHDALINDQMSMAILLVSRGGDLHAKTSYGYTALQLCKNDQDRNILVEASSPFIDKNTTVIPDTKQIAPSAPDKVVFLSSNLDDKQKQQLQKCAQMIKADIVDEFKSDVTHVVTSCDKQGNSVRTMKILMGILSGKWIVNYQWIEVCLEYKRKVDEEAFEVQGTRNLPSSRGPKRGRESCSNKFPPLFDGLRFYLHGNFSSPTPSREEICNLIQVGGGRVLSREPRPTSQDSCTDIVPWHGAGTPFEVANQIVLYQESPPRKKQVREGGVITSQVMWLVACATEYRLLDPLPPLGRSDA